MLKGWVISRESFVFHFFRIVGKSDTDTIKKIEKISKKGLDKYLPMCYNNNIKDRFKS